MKLINKKIKNRYKILEKIGRGSTTDVYRGYCEILLRNITIKILREEFSKEKIFVERFILKSKACFELRNSSIEWIYDTGKDSKIYYAVFEYIDGITLKSLLDPELLISMDTAIRYIKRAIDILRYANDQKIVHSNLKSSNILITKNDEIHITGFGIELKYANSARTVELNSTQNTFYMSPECVKGLPPNMASDVYSFGIICYEMLSGLLPFNGRNPVTIAMKHIESNARPLHQINPMIPTKLSEIVEKMMQKETYERYENFYELKQDLDKFLKIENNFSDNIKNEPVTYERIIKANKSKEIVSLEEKKTPEIKLFENPIQEYKESNFNNRKNMNKRNYKSKKSKIKLFKLKRRTKTKSEKNKEIINPRIQKFVKLSAIVSASCFIAIIALKTIPAVGLNMKTNGLKSSFFFRKKEIEVPNLIGKKFNDAIDKCKGSNFKVIKVASIKSMEEPETIISQAPEMGKKVKNGTSVEICVKVSAGDKLTTLEDYTRYKDFRDAMFELENIGFRVKINKQNSTIVPINSIIKQEPKKGSKLEQGAEITLYVSIGPPTIDNPFKDLLKIPNNEKKDENNETEKNTELNENEKNKDDLSEEKEKITEKNEKNKTQNPKKSGILTIQLPKNNDEINVTLKNSGQIIYNERRKAGEKIEVKLISDDCEVEVDIYFDDVFVRKEVVYLN